MSEPSLNRRPYFLATAVAAAVFLGSCAEPTEDATGTPTTGTASGEVTTITMYTSVPEETVDEINAAFMEENPDIRVEVYRAGTGDLNARIAAERESGGIEADLMWAADAATFEGYKADGDFLPLADVDTDGLIEEAIDPDGYYVGTRIIPTVIAYNTDIIDEADAPRSWSDLVDPRFHGQLVVPDPAVSGAAAYNAAVWLNDAQLGEDWFNALGENQPMIATANGPASQEVAGGGHPVGVIIDYMIRDLADAGSPVEAVYPGEGVPYINQPAAVFSGSDHQEAAERFINFLLSEEGQRLAVEQNYLPVREGIETPDNVPDLADLTLMDPDLEVISSTQDEAVALFQAAIQ